MKSSQYEGYDVLWNRIVWWMDTNISEEHSTSIFRASRIPWRRKEQVSANVFYRIPNCTVLQHRILLSSCSLRFMLPRTSKLYSLSYWQFVIEPEIKVQQNTRKSVQLSDGWREGFDFYQAHVLLVIGCEVGQDYLYGGCRRVVPKWCLGTAAKLLLPRRVMKTAWASRSSCLLYTKLLQLPSLICAALLSQFRLHFLLLFIISPFLAPPSPTTFTRDLFSISSRIVLWRFTKTWRVTWIYLNIQSVPRSKNTRYGL